MRLATSSELRRRWRRQVATRTYPRPERWPRRFGAFGCLVDGGRVGDLMELDRLLIDGNEAA